MMSSDNSDENDTEGATGIDVSLSESHQPADRTKLTNEQILKLLPQQASDGNAQALLPCKERGCKAVSTAANLCNTHFCIRYRNEEIEIPFQVDKNHVVNRPALRNRRNNVQEHKEQNLSFNVPTPRPNVIPSEGEHFLNIAFPNPQSQQSPVHQAGDHNIPTPLYKGNDISESSSSSSSEDEICKKYRCTGPMCKRNSENQNSLCDCCKGHIKELRRRHKKCKCDERKYRRKHHGKLCKYCLEILAEKNSSSVNLPQYYDRNPSSPNTAPPRNQELEGAYGIDPTERPQPPRDESLYSLFSDTGSIITHPEDNESDAQLSFV